MSGRGLGLAGAIALGFGALPYAISGELGGFSLANLAVGALAVLAAAAGGLSRLGRARAPAHRRATVRGLAFVGLALLAAVGLERAAAWTGAQLDWSFQRRFELSDATREALGSLAEQGGVEAFLYHDEFDPRVRSTRILLETLAAGGALRFEERRIDRHPEEEDCFALASSNTIVLTVGPGRPCRRRFERVDRPTEGTLYEALYRLRDVADRVVYVAQGAGDGDLQSTHETGFSGLRAALETEGFALRPIVLPVLERIPPDADAVLLLAPRRGVSDESLDALDTHLRSGGRLVAFVDPRTDAGVVDLLARWGLASPGGVVVDPFSAAVGELPTGASPIAFRYASHHPITEPLSANRMTFFQGARTFEPTKPEPDDEIEAVVWTSGSSWIAADLDVAAAHRPERPPPDVRTAFHPLVVTGVYPREGGEARIVAFGDVDLASNRYLRTLYNLDLVVNALHWATARESAITTRPKHVGVSGRLQFPIPVENTFTLFQSLGLLLPELLLVAGALVWLRHRTA